MGPKKDVKKYDLNDKVMCRHGRFYYEAKIIEIAEEDGETMYTVHYQGWHKRYDERITQNETPDKFLPFTPEIVARCKKEIHEASASKTKKRKTKDGNDDDASCEFPFRAEGVKEEVEHLLRTAFLVPVRFRLLCVSIIDWCAFDPGTTAPLVDYGRFLDRSDWISLQLVGQFTRYKIAKKRAEAGSDTPAATSTTSATEPENKPAVRERDPVLLQELEKLNDMPACLVQIIVDDSDIMTRQRMVSRLPARYTVDSIINDYCAEIGFSSKEGEDSAVADSPAGLGSSAIGLRDFFNGVLG
ncbi:unnamed protein product [Heligmosomoides polygyrus]|uniref:MRG domain-containing protein n=1 Tax=Heligmosomoides polygyrus TaxID=6339 RepID=A0A3P8CGL8_HELPZ|nr:unnamed protein product [Heligmosomoides polygyrus]